MRKNIFTLIVFILAGLLAASIISRLLEPVEALSFLVRSTEIINWNPSADLNFIKYNIFLEMKLNLLSLLGIAGAVWMYRKI